MTQKAEAFVEQVGRLCTDDREALECLQLLYLSFPHHETWQLAWQLKDTHLKTCNKVWWFPCLPQHIKQFAFVGIEITHCRLKMISLCKHMTRELTSSVVDNICVDTEVLANALTETPTTRISCKAGTFYFQTRTWQDKWSELHPIAPADLEIRLNPYGNLLLQGGYLPFCIYASGDVRPCASEEK